MQLAFQGTHSKTDKDQNNEGLGENFNSHLSENLFHWGILTVVFPALKNTSQQHRWVKGWLSTLKSVMSLHKNLLNINKMHLKCNSLYTILNVFFRSVTIGLRAVHIHIYWRNMFQIDLAEPNFSIFLYIYTFKKYSWRPYYVQGFILHFYILTR